MNVLNRSNNYLAILLASLSLSSASCQSGYRASAANLVALERQGQYAGAADLAAKDARSNLNDEADRVIFLLEAGRTAQLAGRVSASTQFYEQAYDIIRTSRMM